MDAAPAHAAEARVLFKPPADDVDFVRVYVGFQPRVYDTTVELRNFQIGSMGDVAAMDPRLSALLSEPRLYFLALTSVDARNRESGFSNEIRIDRRVMGGGTTGGGTPSPTPNPTPRPAPTPTNTGPSVNVLANGQPVTNGVRVRTGQTVSFSTRASDPDGLGFPLFRAFGSAANVTFLWEFGGAAPASALDIFLPNPSVRFTLRSGETRRRFNVQLSVVDRLGAWTNVSVPVDVEPSAPPSVTVLANGTPVGTNQMVMARSGQMIRFTANASDPDGLGFRVFAGFPPVTYFWSSAGTFANALAPFSSIPEIRFMLAPNETQRTFPVMLSVFDATGSVAKREILVSVQR
jgi:hypothetical protein